MPHIAIISSSVRTGRASHRVALYFKKFLENNGLATAEVLDLMEYQFPIFDERLKYQKEPSAETLAFAEKIKSTVPAMFPVPKVQAAFDESGNATDPAGTDKRAAKFINELLWCMEAKKRMVGYLT